LINLAANKKHDYHFTSSVLTDHIQCGSLLLQMNTSLSRFPKLFLMLTKSNWTVMLHVSLAKCLFMHVVQRRLRSYSFCRNINVGAFHCLYPWYSVIIFLVRFH